MLVCVLAAGAGVAMADANQRLTLRDRLREFGFLWSLFVALVGAPSIISLYQSAFVGHDLSALPQSFIEGYEEALAIFGGAVEPVLQPLLAWVSDLLGFEMTLHAHWRSLFVLALILALSYARACHIEMSWGSGLYSGLFGVAGGLAASLAAGSVPLDGGWWAQGLIAGLFAAFFVLFMLLEVYVESALGLSLGDADRALAHKRLRETVAKLFRETAGRTGRGPAILLSIVLWALVIPFIAVIYLGWHVLLAGLIFFAAGAALSFVPGFTSLAGFAVLTGYIVMTGFVLVSTPYDVSRTKDRIVARAGVILVGGFLGAGLVYVADWAIMNWG
jgi:hypothetical protein